MKASSVIAIICAILGVVFAILTIVVDKIFGYLGVVCGFLAIWLANSQFIMGLGVIETIVCIVYTIIYSTNWRVIIYG